MGILDLFLAILQQELFCNLRNANKILHSILFFLISFCLFFFILSGNSNCVSNLQMINNITWFCLLFSIIFANSDFLEDDYKSGIVEQMVIIFPNFELFIASKIISNWLVFCLPIIVTLALLCLLIGLDFKQIINLFFITSLTSFAINSISALTASFSVSENKTSLIAIITLPLIMPILLLAFSSVSDLDNDSCFLLKSLFLLAIFSFIIASFCSAKIVKIILE